MGNAERQGERWTLPVCQRCGGIPGGAWAVTPACECSTATKTFSHTPVVPTAALEAEEKRRVEAERERDAASEPACDNCEDTGIYEEGDEWAPCSECERGRDFTQRLKTAIAEQRDRAEAAEQSLTQLEEKLPELVAAAKDIAGRVEPLSPAYEMAHRLKVELRNLASTKGTSSLSSSRDDASLEPNSCVKPSSASTCERCGGSGYMQETGPERMEEGGVPLLCPACNGTGTEPENTNPKGRTD
jgi:hypothetical protein